MSSTLQARQPAGAPTGGQFAATARTEAPVSLDYPADPPLPPGVTEEDRDYYSNQNCQELAWALHEQTGWPYAAVCDGYSEEAGQFGWLHQGVMAPGGKVLDVNGYRDVDDVLDAYGDASDAEDGDSWLVVENNPGKFAGTETPTGPQAERARRAAAALLAFHPAEEPS